MHFGVRRYTTNQHTNNIKRLYMTMFNKIKKKETVLIILVSVCFLGGLYQGMLMPLLSILLEAQGYSAALNGLNTSALYIGILAAAPFMERSLYRFGFKPILITGTLVLAVQLSIFPFLQSYSIWLVLRFCMGLFNHATFYTILIWIGLIAPQGKRGRYLSYFGFAFGLGFSLGPLLAQLRIFSVSVPFLITSGLCLTCTFFICLLKDRPIDTLSAQISDTTLSQRTLKVLSLAWFALLLPLGYGFMESGICASLPIYLTRQAVDSSSISLLLTCFFLSGLITQLPLGRMSDALGRKKTFIIIITIGLAGFLGSTIISPHHLTLNLIFFVISGGALGSLYSLGITYVTDCIPITLYPAGNMLCSVGFGLGCLLGPFIGGLYIDKFSRLNFIWIFVITFSFILIGIIKGKPAHDQDRRI